MADTLEDKILELVKKLDEEKRLGDKRAKQLYDLIDGLAPEDKKVAVDTLATAGFLGAGASEGVLRVDGGLTKTDGGDYITIGADDLLFTTSPLKAYPVAAAPVNMVSNAVAYAWGTIAEIVPASTITSDFIVVGAYIYCLNTITIQWQAQFMYGAGDTELATFSGASENDTNAVSGLLTIPLFIKVPANSRIRCKINDSDAAQRAYRVRINYIEV